MKLSPLSFLWSFIRPYKWRYLGAIQAGFFTAFFPVAYHYSIKLLLDLLTMQGEITYQQAFWPLLWFGMAQTLFLDLPWRISTLACWHSLPYILQNMIYRIFDHVSKQPYTFFQDRLSGTITTQMKGLMDQFYKIHIAFEFKLTKPIFRSYFQV